MSQTIYTMGLDKNPANYVPLSPLSFLKRAAHVYPDHLSVVHGEVRYTWGQTYKRARRLASALRGRGIQAGDTVSLWRSIRQRCSRRILGCRWLVRFCIR